MSNVKYSENLFLEVAEFNRFQKFMADEGFKRQFLLNTDNFGLIRQANIPTVGNISIANNLYVSKAGTPYDQVIVSKGLAVDGDGNLIINYSDLRLNIPNDSLWYWVKVKYKQSSIEKGSVTIDSLGNCIGVGTKFKDILRGQPNFPSKIRFSNSTNGNADEYEVVKVISDTNMIIQGDFNSEIGLKYSVIGTFTPGFVVSESNKNIFRYDDCDISLMKETNLNSTPNFIEDYEFFIARVKNNGTNLSLQDKRKNWFKSEAVSTLNTLDRITENPLIGVENVKWDVKTSTRSKNLVELSWGFRFNSWTIDTSSKGISILIGNGGIYKDTSQFLDGDFNGWRLYSRNGKFQKIIDSIKSGTQIVITLDVLNPEDYNLNDLLFAVPSYENIEVRVRKDGAILKEGTTEVLQYPNLEDKTEFPINTPLARLTVPALKGCYKYNLTYRYKTFNDYTKWMSFPDDSIGYFNEKSFDELGNLKSNELDRERNPYIGDFENGFIKVCENAYSFDNFQDILNTGDLFGVNTTQFSVADPIINLQVTKNKRYQHFKGMPESPSDPLPNVFTLNSDIYIVLKSFKDDLSAIPCREGNTFILHIEQFLNLSGFKIRVVQNFVNPANYNLVAEINDNDTAYIKNNAKGINKKGMMITCTFNENGKWIAQYDSETTIKGTIRMVEDVPNNAFNISTKLGQISGYFGWQIMEEMLDRVPYGTNSVSQIGQLVGTNSKKLTIAEMPTHNHQWKYGTDSDDKAGGGNRNEWTTNPKGQWGNEGKPADPIEMSGGSQAFDNRPASYKLLFIKKVV